MKNKSLLTLAVLGIMIAAMSGCDWGRNPVSPDLSEQRQMESAVLTGHVVIKTEGDSVSGLIMIGVKGTILRTVPDNGGRFRIDKIPTGNLVVEVTVKGAVSELPIHAVRAGEEIDVIIEVHDNSRAVMAEMKRKGRPSSGDLALEIRPDKWNAAWKDSEDDGDVLAKISGAGFETIEAASVKMIGPEGEIRPYDFDIGDTFFIAKFLQSEAIGLIEKPKAGEIYEIRVQGEFEAGAFDLSAVITIVGRPPSSGPLTLAVRPDKWNPAWKNGDGEVLAQISGEDFETIQPGTVKMIGPEGEIEPRSFDVGGMFFMAKFSQSEAIGLIKDPKAGESHVIQVTGVLEDETIFTLSATIAIVGR